MRESEGEGGREKERGREKESMCGVGLCGVVCSDSVLWEEVGHS